MLELREEPIADLREHANIACEFETRSVYDVREAAGRLELVERTLSVPFRKNYDSVEDPLGWSSALSATRSVRISASLSGVRVAGILAVVASPGLVAWERGENTAILWDLRVDPTHRRQSVATALLRAACTWAQQLGCVELKVETQNTNPAACRFYMRSGFSLLEARFGAYTALPEEVQLIWRKRLDG